MIAVGSETNGYVVGWDGIRALCVAAVIVFHFWPETFPGGFLGVTTFLVLAGVLSVLRIGGELQATGAFDWREYARGRIRRLLPAVLTYTGAVLVWTWVTRPEIYPDIAADAAAAVAYITPWRELAGTVTYESVFDSTPAPFLHTWSLGVEELAWVVTASAIAATRRTWSAVVATFGAGTIGYVLWVGGSDLYYSPARLSEFAIGALVGLVVLRRSVAVPWPLTIIGIGLLSWWTMSWTVADVYSGRLILAATVSAVVVAGTMTGPVARALSFRPLRWVGTRSYALYLWHVGVGELTDLPPLLAIAVTALLADVSYRLIEEPVRSRSFLPGRAIAVLAGMTVVLAAVALVGPRPGIVGPPDLELAAAAAIGGDRPVQVTAPEMNTTSTTAPPVEQRPDSIVVVGDSTAFRLAEALAVWGEPAGIDVFNAGKGGCTPAAQDWDLHLGHPDLPAIPANDECTPDVALIRSAGLVIVSYQGMLAMEHKLPGGEWTTIDREPQLRLALATGLASLAAASDGPVLYLSVPDPLLDRITPAAVDAANQMLADVVSRFDNAELVDNSAVDADPVRYPRSDDLHLDPQGVAAFVLDILDPVLMVDRT